MAPMVWWVNDAGLSRDALSALQTGWSRLFPPASPPRAASARPVWLPDWPWTGCQTSPGRRTLLRARFFFARRVPESLRAHGLVDVDAAVECRSCEAVRKPLRHGQLGGQSSGRVSLTLAFRHRTTRNLVVLSSGKPWENGPDLNLVRGEKLSSPNLGKSWEKPWENYLNFFPFSRFPRTLVRNLNLLLVERGTGLEPATSTLGRLFSRAGVFPVFASILPC